MMTPLVSVVIPTCGRPQYLLRAVRSAVDTMGQEVEIVVVPNGDDDSWREALAPLARDPRVRIDPIGTRHANAARNHGLQLARGRYLRFLDDDDYLLPAAAGQIARLESTGAEVCSGLLANVDQDGSDLGLLSMPPTRDFVSAATCLSGFTLPIGHLFRRASLEGCQWDPRVDRAQDYAWLLQLASRKEWEWVHLDQVVGAWFQHDRQRTSSVRVFGDLERPVIERLLSLHDALRENGRLNQERQAAVAAALWHYANWRFPAHPLYWSRVARQARKISPGSRPAYVLFSKGPLRYIHPLLLEWSLLPARSIARFYRKMASSQISPEYRRRL